MATNLPRGRFDTSSLVQPGVATSYSRRSGEGAPVHTVAPEPKKEIWYDTNRFYQVVKTFHDNYCRQPEMTAAKATHERFTKSIECKLRAMDICKRLEYKGSSYEGVKVQKNPSDMDLEFDVMVIMVGGDKLAADPVPGRPGYVELYERDALPKRSIETGLTQLHLQSMVTPGRQLSEKVARQFFGALQKVINNSDEMRDRILLRRHGPTATQMDVYTGPIARGAGKFYSVDMVPAYEVNGTIYLVKPLDDNDDNSPMVWRECFSMQEKAKLVGIDSDQGCRRQVLRVVKVIRNASPELRKLSSYHLKTTLFREVDDKPSKYNWMFDRLGIRVVDLLRRLENDLMRGFMCHYYIPGANLLQKFSPAAMSNMENRLHALVTSETELIKLMTNYGR